MVKNIDKVSKKSDNLTAKENFRIEYIDVDKIQINPKNFYGITNIDELAEDIKLNGLNHNLVVRDLGNGRFRLISGQRRYTALLKLVEEGENKFRLVPCKVLEISDTDEEIILIQANAQGRELTDLEKLKQVERLKELFEIKKANGEPVPKKAREFISENLKMSKSAVGRLQAISNNLIPELKALLSEKLSLSNANEFQALSKESQQAVLEIINKQVALTKNEAIELKQEMQKIEEEKAKAERLCNEKIRTKEEEYNNNLRQEIQRLQNSDKEVFEKLNNDINKYKNRSEIAIQDLEDIKSTREQYEKDIKEKLKNEFEEEKEKIRREVENTNNGKYEKVIKELENKKNEEKELKNQLEQIRAKANADKNTIESVKFNSEIMTKLKDAVKVLNEVDIKVEEKLTKDKNFIIMDELVNIYEKLQKEINIFQTHMKEHLNLS